MSTVVTAILVVLAVGVGFFAGYKTRERKLVRQLREAAEDQYVETADDLANIIDPDKSG